MIQWILEFEFQNHLFSIISVLKTSKVKAQSSQHINKSHDVTVQMVQLPSTKTYLLHRLQCAPCRVMSEVHQPSELQKIPEQNFERSSSKLQRVDRFHFSTLHIILGQLHFKNGMQEEKQSSYIKTSTTSTLHISAYILLKTIRCGLFDDTTQTGSAQQSDDLFL